jgi:hypothetical protein
MRIASQRVPAFSGWVRNDDLLKSSTKKTCGIIIVFSFVFIASMASAEGELGALAMMASSAGQMAGEYFDAQNSVDIAQISSTTQENIAAMTDETAVALGNINQTTQIDLAQIGRETNLDNQAAATQRNGMIDSLISSENTQKFEIQQDELAHQFALNNQTFAQQMKQVQDNFALGMAQLKAQLVKLGMDSGAAYEINSAANAPKGNLGSPRIAGQFGSPFFGSTAGVVASQMRTKTAVGFKGPTLASSKRLLSNMMPPQQTLIPPFNYSRATKLLTQGGVAAGSTSQSRVRMLAAASPVTSTLSSVPAAAPSSFLPSFSSAQTHSFMGSISGTHAGAPSLEEEGGGVRSFRTH